MIVASACSASPDAASPDPGAPAPRAEAAEGRGAKPDRPQEGARARRDDPRRDGLDIALGEWAVTPESDAIRPGRVTFVVRNRGTIPHGFEIELEGDSSGSGSGDLFKAETELLDPGEETRMTVDLPPGLYKIECLVDGHDDMGMEAPFEVRSDAPLKKVRPRAAPDAVTIDDFAFSPAEITAEAGTEIVWSNSDAAPHTVTELDGAFDSGTLEPGDPFAHVFDEPGAFSYRCEIHPEMQGRITIE